MTVQIGWWAIPLILTVIAFIAAKLAGDQSSGGYLSGLDGLIFGTIALIASLIFWLIWAVLT